MKLPFHKKLTLLNQGTLDSFIEEDTLAILEKFTLLGLTVMEADFGFAWWKPEETAPYQLAYKSPTTPYDPKLPREKGGNFKAKKDNEPFFIESVRTENYEKEYDVSPYMKSYVIIPISYNDFQFGSFVLCFKEEHFFNEEDEGIATALGNTAAQAIRIHRLVVIEQRERETKLLLDQEKLKTDFLAEATHEIRTPLAIIRGNVDLATATTGSTAQKLEQAEKAFKEINFEIEHLSLLLGDLALLSTPGKDFQKRIHFDTVDLREVIESAAMRMRTVAQGKKIQIEIADTPPLLMKGDKMYLEKLFLNLLRNAVTYGKENGFVKVEMHREKDWLRVAVSDDGIGISVEDSARVFERFFKADYSTNSNQRRMGLGLAIAKWVVETHGGTIEVASTLGSGSTFTVSFPLLG